MLIFLILFVGTLTILLSYHLFGKWFNHLAIYAFSWMTMLYLYELRLISFVTLSTQTWLVISAAFLSFFIGTITIFSTRKSSKLNPELTLNSIFLFGDRGKILKYAIYILSIIGLLSALQHWSVLLNQYGTVSNALLNAYHIYKTRTSGELKGVIPYIWLVIYPAIFLSGIYTAYKNKLTIATILPIIALILKEVANLSRSGILFGFSEFLISFMLFRHFLKQEKSKKTQGKIKIVLGVSVLILLFIVGAAFVKTVRQATDSFKGTSGSLAKLEGGAFISPSIYFYAASQVGVLNQFLEADKEKWSFGSNTFFTLYSALSKFDLVEQPPIYQQGYFIPDWSNTGTYLREVYGDFGYVGIFIVPYLLGLLSSLYWFKFYEKGKLQYLIILTHLYVVITISFFVLIIRSPAWTIGGIFLLLTIPFLERLVTRKLAITK